MVRAIPTSKGFRKVVWIRVSWSKHMTRNDKRLLIVMAIVATPRLIYAHQTHCFLRGEFREMVASGGVCCSGRNKHLRHCGANAAR
jgi:hypothetical protein